MSIVSFGCADVRGSGRIITVEQELDSVNDVSVCCGWDVYVDESETSFVRITGDDNIVARIDVDARGSSVDIAYDGSSSFDPSQIIVVEIGVATLAALDASGGAFVTVAAPGGNEVRVDASGGSTVRFPTIDGSSIGVDLSGGSDVFVAGVANTITADISGGSDLAAQDLTAAAGFIDASGGSDATVHVTERLVAEASGGSDIRYLGSPRVESDVSGGSSVERR